jgi:purine-binding chemotaxis protein CheW
VNTRVNPTPSAAEILRARARAAALETPDAVEATLSVIEFALADERYAFEMSFVTKVHPLEQLTALPGTPDFLAGVINVRGRIVAVMDLKRFFELPEKGITDLHRVIVVNYRDVELGILADNVTGTREISLARLQPPLPTLTGVRAGYLKGISDDRLIVLDAARMLTDPKIIIDERVAG